VKVDWIFTEGLFFGPSPNGDTKPGFRVTEWINNHWTFLFGSAAEDGSSPIQI
jgi:hypothetical protein